MYKKILIALASLSLLLVACAAKPQNVSAVPTARAPSAPPAERAVGQSGGGAGAATGEYTAPVPEARRIVIKNASLSIVVDDPSLAMDAISRMAEAMNGFVVSANLYKTYTDSGAEVPRASITVRVPAEKLNDALAQIKAQSTQPVLSESITSEDVTSQYTDLQSRLTNLEAAEAQLQQIMDSATKTEDVLAVYNQLVSVREQIEVIKGQIKYYDESAALSAISVELIADEAVQPLSIGGWQPVGVAKQALQALISAVKFLINVGIWLVLFVIPLLLMIGTPPALLVGLVLYVVRRRKKAKAEPGEPQ